MDGEQFEGGEGRGQVVELGSGRLIPGFEEQLKGASAGDERTVEVTFPDDYPAEQLAGKDASFAVEVKEVKEKRLPELDDDFAVEAGGFDSLDELRAEIESRIAQAEERAIEARVPRGRRGRGGRRRRRSRCRRSSCTRRRTRCGTAPRGGSQAQGINPEQYLQMTGKTEEELVVESEPDAETALKREAVLAAIVEAEGIEVTDEEIEQALRASAPPDASDKQLKRALKRARSQGADEALREDIAMRKAVDLVVENAKPIEAERAAAREKIWTPGLER